MLKFVEHFEEFTFIFRDFPRFCQAAFNVICCMPRRLTRTDTFRFLWIFCFRKHYSIPLSPCDGMCQLGLACADSFSRGTAQIWIHFLWVISNSLYTFQHVFKDHPKDWRNESGLCSQVVFNCRVICAENELLECGCYKPGIAIQRCSLAQVWLYSYVQRIGQVHEIWDFGIKEIFVQTETFCFP